MARHDLRWFKCYPADAQTGSRGLSPAQFKAYWLLLFEMYARGGPVPYDKRRLKFLLEVRPQDVDRLIDQLVGLGKLSVQNGFIHNGRSDYEIERMNEKWSRSKGSDDQPSDQPFETQMELHIPGHISEMMNENNEAPASARVRDHAHPRQKIDGRRGTARPQQAGAVPLGTDTALPPREARSVAAQAGGAALPPSPSPSADPDPDTGFVHERDRMSPQERAAADARRAALLASLGAGGIGSAFDPSKPVKRTEQQHGEPDDDAEPGGDRGDQGELPQPSGAAPGDAEPAGNAEAQGGDRGDERGAETAERETETEDEKGLWARVTAQRRNR